VKKNIFPPTVVLLACLIARFVDEFRAPPWVADYLKGEQR
jgi:hypothetical protein